MTPQGRRVFIVDSKGRLFPFLYPITSLMPQIISNRFIG
jgi:hypothetical protein